MTETTELTDREPGLAAEVARLEKLVYVPGLWRCPKCEFQLLQANLNAHDGSVTSRDQPGDKCPNCDSPLWRVTERDAGNKLIDDSERISAELVEARKALASTERNRDMWKGQCERQAERLTAINSLPEPCVESLSPLCQQQIDEHGVLVAVSRQAADEIYGALKVARAALSPKNAAASAPEAAE